jgi:hypothetical protein
MHRRFEVGRSGTFLDRFKSLSAIAEPFDRSCEWKYAHGTLRVVLSIGRSSVRIEFLADNRHGEGHEWIPLSHRGRDPCC